MGLETFFMLSVGIFCSISTIALILFFIWGIKFSIQLDKIAKQVEQIAIISKETAKDVKGFVDRTIATIEKFKENLVTVETIRKIATEVVEVIQKNKKK